MSRFGNEFCSSLSHSNKIYIFSRIFNITTYFFHHIDIISTTQSFIGSNNNSKSFIFMSLFFSNKKWMIWKRIMYTEKYLENFKDKIFFTYCFILSFFHLYCRNKLHCFCNFSCIFYRVNLSLNLFC